MIELPNGKVARTLPEQVGHLTKEIENIRGFIDGINVQNNLVKVAASSGILTAKEMEIVSRSVAFIEYNSNLYVKANTTATEFIFKQIALSASDQGSYNILQSFRIVITKASGAYAYSSNTVLSLYNKAEMDTILATKANSSALDAKADIAGQNFTGAITAPSIIENMTGYNWTSSSITNLTKEEIFVGAVKNGNKLTFVWCGYLTRTDASATSGTIGYLTIPESVGSNLYPAAIGLYDWLDCKSVKAFVNTVTGVEVYMRISKNSNTQINIQSTFDNMTVNTKYFVRYEATFLLSDNLAS